MSAEILMLWVMIEQSYKGTKLWPEERVAIEPRLREDEKWPRRGKVGALVCKQKKECQKILKVFSEIRAECK